jgi:phosphatidylinositol alpha-1,6-mannosyltransferase
MTIVQKSQIINKLRIGVILEERFKRLPNGRIFSPGGFGNEFWYRYVHAFGRVVIVARVENTDESEESWAEVSLEDIEICPIEPYIGPFGILRKFLKVLISISKSMESLDGVIIRAPSALGMFAALTIRRIRLPFAVEVVGDPSDIFAFGIGGIFSSVYRVVFVSKLKWLCTKADCVSYVTQWALQKRYPAKLGARTFAVPGVHAPKSIFAAAPRQALVVDEPIIFCAASLEVPYKGVDVLLDALATMALPPRLNIAGEGRIRAKLEARAVRLGLNERVSFLGHLSRDEVLKEMRRCTVYVQPSLTEGLPRAVIEAMATAAPVLASKVGGIPELLRPEDMVPPGNALALAALLENVLADPQRRRAMSIHSIKVAENYEVSVIEERRSRFLAEFRGHVEGAAG